MKRLAKELMQRSTWLESTWTELQRRNIWRGWLRSWCRGVHGWRSQGLGTKYLAGFYLNWAPTQENMKRLAEELMQRSTWLESTWTELQHRSLWKGWLGSWCWGVHCLSHLNWAPTQEYMKRLAEELMQRSTWLEKPRMRDHMGNPIREVFLHNNHFKNKYKIKIANCKCKDYIVAEYFPWHVFTF